MNIGWTTLANRKDAEKLARDVVEAKMAVCAQVDGPITSFYYWEGKPRRDEEFRVAIKFLSANSEAIETWINEHHPYDTPQWLVVAAERVLPGYRRWAEGNCECRTPQRTKKDVIRLSKLGRNYLRKRCYVEAEKTFLEALELDPHNAYILVGLGDTCREMKKYETAISHYEKVLEFDSVNVFALRGIGDAYRGILQHKRAIPYWLRYLECNKDDIYVMVRLAESFNKTGNFERAEDFYKQALAVNPEDKYALLGLGSLYYKIENDDLALEYFDKLLSLDGGYVAVLTMVGNIYRRRREYARALDFYKRAIAIEPWNTFALYGLGDCCRGLENLEEAVSWWAKILEKEPNNQDLLTRVGDAMVNLGDADKAIDHYRRSLEAGFDLYALLGLARVFKAKGELRAAADCCEQILEKVPEHQRTLEELHGIYLEMGEAAKAGEVRDVLDGLGAVESS